MDLRMMESYLSFLMTYCINMKIYIENNIIEIEIKKSKNKS